MSNSTLYASGAEEGIRILLGEYRATLRDWSYPESSGDFWRLYWNPTPGAGIVRNGKTYPLDGENVVLIPPLTVFSSFSRQEFEHFFIHFSAPPPFDRTRREIVPLPAGPLKEELLSLRLPQPEHKFRLRTLRIAAAALLQLSPEWFLPETEHKTDQRIRTALRLLNDVTQPAYNCSEICNRISMSPNNFHVLFKRETGLTPMRYRLSVRMEKAARLLSRSGLTIKEIADQTGFANRYHFSKAFKNFFHITPAEFRRRNS